MFRIYFVKETEYGLCIEGPNGHKWVCKDETWSRATGLAKGFERAYLEGQKSITQDVDLAVAMNALADLSSDVEALSPEALKARLASLAEKVGRAARKLEKIRALNEKTQLHKGGEPNAETQDDASAKADDTNVVQPSVRPIFRRTRSS